MQIFASASFKNVVVSFGITGRVEALPRRTLIAGQIQPGLIATWLSSRANRSEACAFSLKTFAVLDN